jgi:hypothetical protein
MNTGMMESLLNKRRHRKSYKVTIRQFQVFRSGSVLKCFGNKDVNTELLLQLSFKQNDTHIKKAAEGSAAFHLL